MSATARSVDALLGGRVVLVQPTVGHHRSGSDAVFLAAAVPATTEGLVLDLGAGAGAAGLCLAARVPSVTVTLVERDPALVACARESLAHPINQGFADRVRALETDLLAPARIREAAGLPREAASAVIMNPPYWSPGEVRVTPKAAKADAHVLAEGGLEAWVRVATSLVRPRGLLAIVFRADRLTDLLATLQGRFGDAGIVPLHPRPGEAAIRVLVTAIKGSRAAPRLMPGLVLHEAGSANWTARAQAIQRDGRGLGDPLEPPN